MRSRYYLKRLTKECDRRFFSCGVPELDRYIQHQASQDMRRNAASVYVAIDSDSEELHGFYTLSMTSVSLDLLPEDMARKMPRYPALPAILLGRLAVHREAQGTGVGRLLLVDAMRRALASEIAWAALIVEAKDAKVRAWYESFGFRRLADSPNHLFVPRQFIERLNLD